MNKKLAYKKPGLLNCLNYIGVLGCSLWITPSWGLTFPMPDKNTNIIGEVQYVISDGESLSLLGRRFDMGGYEMIEANPGVSFEHPHPGTKITIPAQFILPPGPRKGVVVNLAEMRVYVYHTGGREVSTFPIGIGQEGWLTPTGTTHVIRKRKDPIWVPPDSIRENSANHGNILPDYVPAGPDNPLGPYAVSLGFKNIVMHGTPWEAGVGVRSSHGCIRLLNADVESLYYLVSVNMPVQVMHQSSKVGFKDNYLYLESHVPVDEDIYPDTYTVEQQLTEILRQQQSPAQGAHVRWDVVENLEDKATGIPTPFGNIVR